MKTRMIVYMTSLACLIFGLVNIGIGSIIFVNNYNLQQGITILNSGISTATKSIDNIQQKFQQQANFFNDWNILGMRLQTTQQIGSTFETMANEISSIKSNIQNIQPQVSYLTSIFPFLVYTIAGYFVLQGVALAAIGISIVLLVRDRKLL